MNMADDTPLLDDLEKGPWPSFVKEMKRAAKKNAAAKDLLGVVELSYRDKITHWKHGGIVGVTDTAAGLSGVIPMCPKSFRTPSSFIPCVSTTPRRGSTTRSRCARSATSGRSTEAD
jgi:sulfite reductase alpha subunit